MSDPTTPEEKRKTSSRRSPKESSGQCITSEGFVSQTTDLNASADVFALAAAGFEGSSGMQKRAVLPSLSLTYPVLPQSSPVSSASSPVSSASSPQSSRQTSRLLFPNAQSRSKCSDPAPWEPEQGPSAAQTTLSPSPASRKSQTPLDKPRTVRPTSEPRTASDPTPLTGGSGVSSGTKVERAQDIDGDIENQIRQPKKLSKRDKELGYVYVVPAEIDGKKVIKIGHTTEASVNTRIKGIMTGKCGNTIQILPLEDTSPEHTQVHLFYEQVEKLAHKELANFRHDFICLCGKRHEEFFVVDEEIGHMVVGRWAQLCTLRPFDKDFVLKDEWKFYLDQFRKRNHGRPSENQHEKKDNHLGRHQRWESFLASKRSDWHVHRACELGSEVLHNRWQLCSFVLAVLLAIFRLSWWSFGILIVVAVGVCLEKLVRNLVVEFVSLLCDVVVHYLRTVSGNPTWAASQAQQVGKAEDKEGMLDI